MPFIDADKAVLEIEYKLDRADFCSKALSLGFSSMKKRRRWARGDEPAASDTFRLGEGERGDDNPARPG